MEFTGFELGKVFPRPLPHSTGDGASAQFLTKPGNQLIITYDTPSSEEIRIINEGEMYAGIIVDQPAIILLFAIGSETFECPFDIRIIPEDYRELVDITKETQRLAVVVHLVDSRTKIVKANRLITLSPQTTLGFLAAIQDQLADVRGTDIVLDRYLNLPQQTLFKMGSMLPCGQAN